MILPSSHGYLKNILSIAVIVLVSIFIIHRHNNGFKFKHHEGPAEAIRWQDAAKYVGHYVSVSGKIQASHNTGKVCMLNFDPDYRTYLTLVIFSNSFDKFPEKPEEYYLDKEVVATGLVKEYKGKPEIIVESQDQIKIADVSSLRKQGSSLK